MRHRLSRPRISRYDAAALHQRLSVTLPGRVVAVAVVAVLIAFAPDDQTRPLLYIGLGVAVLNAMLLVLRTQRRVPAGVAVSWLALSELAAVTAVAVVAPSARPIVLVFFFLLTLHVWYLDRWAGHVFVALVVTGRLIALAAAGPTASELDLVVGAAQAVALAIIGGVINELAHVGIKQRRDLAASKQRLDRALVDLEAGVDARIRGERMLALNQVTAYAANKINNALMAATASTELVLAANHLEPVDRDDLRIAHSEGLRAGQAVQDLLTLTLLPLPNLEPVLLEEIAAAVVGEAKMRADVRDVRIVLDVPAGSTVLHADLHHLRRLCEHLVENATKVAPADSHVFVSVKRGAAMAQLQVKDLGSGIPQVILDELDEPFSADEATGIPTGIGLAVVNRIVTTHGWFIDFETSPETGTTVTVGMPLMEGAHQPARTPEAVATP